jgi:hypothetical protein
MGVWYSISYVKGQGDLVTLGVGVRVGFRVAVGCKGPGVDVTVGVKLGGGVGVIVGVAVGVHVATKSRVAVGNGVRLAIRKRLRSGGNGLMGRKGFTAISI